MRLMFFLFFLLCGATACAERQAQLLDLDGKQRALLEFVGRGHWVMVNIWSPGCSHCLDEMPTLTSFHAENEVGAKVLGIAVDYPGFGYPQPNTLNKFAAAHAINFPVLMADGEQAGAFIGDKVDLVPITIAFDPGGRPVARWHGVITRNDINEIIRDFSVTKP